MGMLSNEEQNAQPGDQPLPEQSPGQETVQGDKGSELKKLSDQATLFVYDQRFDELLEMFKANGAEGFPRAMASAVNGALEDLKKNNQVSHEMAATVGMDLFLKILGDVGGGTVDGQPVVPGLAQEQIEPALKATIEMYANSNPDITEQDVQALFSDLDSKATDTAQKVSQEKGGEPVSAGADTPAEQPAEQPVEQPVPQQRGGMLSGGTS